MNGPLVVKIGGTTLEAQASTPELWSALVALARRQPGGLVLVHGGGKAVDRLLARLGCGVERAMGLRITPPDQMEVIAGVLAGSINKSLVGCIARAGGRAVGLCLGDGGMTVSGVLRREGVDLGRVGEVTGGDGGLARTLLAEGYIPVVSSIGIDGEGGLLNINADDAAAGLAAVLGASALVLLTDVAGVRAKDGTTIEELTPAGVESLIGSGEITGGMIPKARAAAAVARDRGVPVVLMSGDSPEHLISWTKGGRTGTRFVP